MTAVCSICWWEIGGLELSEDEVCAGPNKGYSLRRARANFLDHGHMYDAVKPIDYLATESEGRTKLMNYVRAVQRGEEALDPSRLHVLIDQERDSWPWRTSSADPSADGPDEEALLRALMTAGDG